MSKHYESEEAKLAAGIERYKTRVHQKCGMSHWYVYIVTDRSKVDKHGNKYDYRKLNATCLHCSAIKVRKSMTAEKYTIKNRKHVKVQQERMKVDLEYAMRVRRQRCKEQAKAADNLTNGYLRQQIRKMSNNQLSAKDIPQQLVESMRYMTQLNRTYYGKESNSDSAQKAITGSTYS